MRKIVYAANQKNGYLVLQALQALPLEIEYLIVHSEEGGRYVQDIIQTSRVDKSRVLFWDKSRIDSIREALTHKESDTFFSVNFGYRIPGSILSLFSLPLNLHTSFLPYNKGAYPNVWSIIDGTPAGVTIHVMSEEFDEGPIVFQKEVAVECFDTGKSLYAKLMQASVALIEEHFNDIMHNRFTLKKHTGGTYHTEKDFKDLLRIDKLETLTADQFINRLRALTFPPFRNLYFECNGEKIFIDINFHQLEDAE